MSWARLDDRANEHRKQLIAGPEACWLWACGLMYANRQDARDGFIPEPMLAMLYPFKAPKKLASKLVDVGLWDAVPGGYQIHAYHEWNPTREQVEAERAKGRQRASRSYQNRKPKKTDSSPEDSGCSSPEDETKKTVSSGVVVVSGSGSLSEGVSGEDGETVCPPTLAEGLIRIGVAAELAGPLGVPVGDVEASLREFVGYWTIGGGANKRRRNWASRAREWVRGQSEQGKLHGLSKRLNPPEDPAVLAARRARDTMEAADRARAAEPASVPKDVAASQRQAVLGLVGGIG